MAKRPCQPSFTGTHNYKHLGVGRVQPRIRSGISSILPAYPESGKTRDSSSTSQGEQGKLSGLQSSNELTGWLYDYQSFLSSM